MLDAFSRRIVGWQLADHLRTDLPLDALEVALWQRGRDRPVQPGTLIHHSDRGCQYVSFRYTTRLTDLGVTASVGSVADSYDNAMAESLNATFKTELIHRRTWRTRDQVEYAIVEWVGWYNHCRLHTAIGDPHPSSTRPRTTVPSTHQRRPAPGKPDFIEPGGLQPSSPGGSCASSAVRPLGSPAWSRPPSACTWPAQTEDGKRSRCSRRSPALGRCCIDASVSVTVTSDLLPLVIDRIAWRPSVQPAPG